MALGCPRRPAIKKSSLPRCDLIHTRSGQYDLTFSWTWVELTKECEIVGLQGYARSAGAPILQKGLLVRTDERLAVHQSTDIGDIDCEISVPLDICSRRSARSWNEMADALVEQAVRQRYAKL